MTAIRLCVAFMMVSFGGGRLFSQVHPEVAYPPVERWAKENKLPFPEDPLDVAMEKAILHNIRVMFIQNGIPAESYQAVLEDLILEVYQNAPSKNRAVLLLGLRDYLFKSLSLRNPKSGTGLRESRLPTVNLWLKENQLKIARTWEGAYLELALLYNLRFFCLVNDVPQETYRAMLRDTILPILKTEPGKKRGDALLSARDLLLRFPNGFQEKDGSGKSPD